MVVSSENKVRSMEKIKPPRSELMNKEMAQNKHVKLHMA